jgi:hypothetical protein
MRRSMTSGHRFVLGATLAVLVATNGVSTAETTPTTVTYGKARVYNDRTRTYDTMTIFASDGRKALSKIQAQGTVWNVECYYAQKIKGGHRIGIRARTVQAGGYLYLLLDDYKEGTDRAVVYIPFPDKEDDPPFCGFGDGVLYTPIMRPVNKGSFSTRAI